MKQGQGHTRKSRHRHRHTLLTLPIKSSEVGRPLSPPTSMGLPTRWTPPPEPSATLARRFLDKVQVEILNRPAQAAVALSIMGHVWDDLWRFPQFLQQ